MDAPGAVVEFDRSAVLQAVRDVIRSEAASLNALADRLDEHVAEAVELLYRCSGRVIVTGMGKMGAVARKAAATLCSTGAPAIFLHPSEAVHGDLGIVSPSDVLMAMSYSGETAEIVQLVPLVRRFGVPVIAITGQPRSVLAQRADVVLVAKVDNEADPISLAPTCSTTAALALCDGLSVALMKVRGFTRDQFAIFHPGGQLGRKLLLTVADLMHRGTRLPVIEQHATLRDVVVLISNKALGAAFLVDEQGKLTGIITDGDLRRIFQSVDNPLASQASDLMTRQPTSIQPRALAAEALRLMEQRAITVLPVTDEHDTPVGAVHLHDLIQAGLA